jgi:diaminohydroxyphosphoribosylaminopyrimidine deaminase/5-amino-6-(5-phosphoribosylamino)uracil reductase
MDPTSRGEGGASVLRAAGVDVETGVLVGEAHMVLGPWLIALSLGRPLIIWPYLLSDNGITELPEEAPDAGLLRLSADAVLLANGHIQEAVPDSHGTGILELKARPPGMEPGQFAETLYSGGVRLLLLQGGMDVAAPFLAARLTDRVVAYLPAAPSSRRSAAPQPWALLPAGFGITEIVRLGEFVRVTGERT